MLLLCKGLLFFDAQSLVEPLLVAEELIKLARPAVPLIVPTILLELHPVVVNLSAMELRLLHEATILNHNRRGLHSRSLFLLRVEYRCKGAPIELLSFFFGSGLPLARLLPQFPLLNVLLNPTEINATGLTFSLYGQLVIFSWN